MLGNLTVFNHNFFKKSFRKTDHQSLAVWILIQAGGFVRHGLGHNCLQRFRPNKKRFVTSSCAQKGPPVSVKSFYNPNT